MNAQWTDQQPLPPVPPQIALWPQESRSALLEALVRKELASTFGARLDSRPDPFTATIVTGGARPNHILHLLLTLLTFGLWAVIWLAVSTLGAPRRRVMLHVDQQGVVHRTKLRG
jgi:hypothetical protein